MTTHEFEIKQGDTGPNLTTVLLGSDGLPVDLTSALSVGLTMRLAKHPKTLVLNNVAASFTPDGAVSYEWGPLDTAVAGLYNIEWTAVWGDGFIMSFPSCGFDRVRVNEKA